MSVQTTEQKKEEFRKYLEKAGVIDQLTKVLVGLYEEPEKPGNVIDFIKKSLGAPSDTDVEQLMAENEELKRQKKIDANVPIAKTAISTKGKML